MTFHARRDDPIRSLTESATGHFHEHSAWTAHAVEDLRRAVARLITAAEDEHKMGTATTAEDYYSRALAEILAEQPVRFNPAYLQ